jgi:hypothetical protein
VTSVTVEGQVRKLDSGNPAAVARAERNIFEQLMAGITLGAAQTDTARELIHIELAQRLRIIESKEPDAAQRARDSYRKRDAAIKALLSSPAERRRFERNAETLHPLDPT